ncbi:hypothetical protein MYTO111405_04115 [Mycoplasma todarodis]
MKNKIENSKETLGKLISKIFNNSKEVITSTTKDNEFNKITEKTLKDKITNVDDVLKMIEKVLKLKNIETPKVEKIQVVGSVSSKRQIKEFKEKLEKLLENKVKLSSNDLVGLYKEAKKAFESKNSEIEYSKKLDLSLSRIY